ncbi:protein gp37 [Enhydrobacter aerosaccus]|uniref:Protein gp37 n=1 Tax=Enhydrobacter aerosaccus TaxID=225324 RepID=A0A1T4JSW6_9HYPH|nr:phage Gp37/Gp68 family protein [Enhydrobacter aerosaccus]SJZ33231.1 protein gp37 [Enhydrobacter aerosaccus]
MAERTKIEWVDHTFNPWIGCTRVSDACDNCYAAAMSRRRGWAEFEPGAPRHRTSATYWRQPLVWNRKAEARRTRAKVFGPSLADPFDAEISDAWRHDYIDLIKRTPWLDYILLTKRPQVAVKFFCGRRVPDNLWLGVTAETQKMLALRAPTILDIKAKVHVLSAEPLLEQLDLAPWLPGPERNNRQSFTWVIAGGESGPKARASKPQWFRILRDQCAAAGIAFFFKQWGEHAPDDERRSDDNAVRKLGRKTAGACLDGRHHRDTPL